MNDHTNMKTIYKYPIRIVDHQTVNLPKDAQILCCQTQNGEAYLWALLDTEQQHEPRNIHVVGTGKPINDDDHKYIGTIQTPPFVWHVFEEL